MKITKTLKKVGFYTLAIYVVLSFLFTGSVAEESSMLTMILSVLNFAAAAILFGVLAKGEADDESDWA